MPRLATRLSHVRDRAAGAGGSVTRVRAFAREEPLLLAIVACAAVAYAAYSLLRHHHLGSGTFDLGLHDQGMWHLSRFETPESTLFATLVGSGPDVELGLPNLLGDHFSPILALLAPLYWVWPDPRMLLIAQAVLIAVSAVPVFLYARPRLGRPGAHLIALAYLSFWGTHAAVEYDFHELAFAPLFIALAIYWADLDRWKSCFAALALLLLTKEDSAVFLVFFGVYLLVLRRPRQAFAAIAAGVAWYALVVKLLIPHLAGGRDYNHWYYGRLGSDFPDALRNVVRHPGLPFSILVDPPEKTRTLLKLVVPFLGTIVYSPLLILALFFILANMLAADELEWSTQFHHWLAIAPVLAMGAADGLKNLIGWFGFGRRAMVVAAAAAAAIVVGNVALAKRFPLWQGLSAAVRGDVNIADAHEWQGLPGYEEAAGRAFDRVPAHSGSVAAQNELVPHLSARSRIHLIRPPFPAADYLVFHTSRGSPFPYKTVAEQQRAIAPLRPRYDRIFAEKGFEVLRRKDVR